MIHRQKNFFLVVIVMKSSNSKRPDNNTLVFCIQELFHKSQQEKCYWSWKGNIWLYLAAASVFFFEINCKLSIEENSIYRKKCLLYLSFSKFSWFFYLNYICSTLDLLGKPVALCIYSGCLWFVLWELMLENYLVLFWTKGRVIQELYRQGEMYIFKNL